ncbi:hypothetical protein [Paeniglutamicibacter psychrophenolicus]|uniref:Uncharacterized protein n=1 Tax=Paeniglutamicibacter psychrophenolicus TaxID=257454 RepID=A0ABS4WF25_9MICC|nr:hypothetical protein [Paeniglutamicibacter psychrophenolicus]MBP2374796.1 hypothetical protein [Paeniglutamicibacter psychrophenolicus]
MSIEYDAQDMSSWQSSKGLPLIRIVASPLGEFFGINISLEKDPSLFTGAFGKAIPPSVEPSGTRFKV